MSLLASCGPCSDRFFLAFTLFALPAAEQAVLSKGRSRRDDTLGWRMKMFRGSLLLLIMLAPFSNVTRTSH